MEESLVDKQTTTIYPPCCLRILHDKFIILGTYELEKKTGFRVGSLDILDDNLQVIRSHPTYGAILDLKVSPFDETLLCSGHSTGNVMLWRFCNDHH